MFAFFFFSLLLLLACYGSNWSVKLGARGHIEKHGQYGERQNIETMLESRLLVVISGQVTVGADWTVFIVSQGFKRYQLLVILGISDREHNSSDTSRPMLGRWNFYFPLQNGEN